MDSLPRPPFYRRSLPLWGVFLFIVLASAATAGTIYYVIGGPQAELMIGLPPPLSGKVLQYGSQPALSNPDFFKTVKNDFLAKKASFIEADLSEMKVRVYQNGVLAKEVPIKTKGKEGSWWETPAGLYKIETKEKNHFSSFGHVNQPWSMAFQGNFFIHGWPTEPDGTPVSSTYSGGCIRLADEDAKSVYDLATVGMPILVFEKDFGSDSFSYEVNAPNLTSTSYLAADLKNNFVFAQKNTTVQVPIASLTKLITALVSAEYINLDKQITITSSMTVKTSLSRLVPGEKVSAYSLLYPLLMESSNEAAEALAQSVGRERFISLMNQKAVSLGMTHTHFADPAGSSADNISTAEDLFQLAKYIYNNRSFVLKISTGKVTGSAYDAPKWNDLQNFNIYNGVPGFVGGKVGKTTAAKETALMLFEREVSGEKRPTVFIVLGADNNKTDEDALRAYVEAVYSGKGFATEQSTQPEQQAAELTAATADTNEHL